MKESRTSPLPRVLGLALLALGVLGSLSLSMKEIPLAVFGKKATGRVHQVEVVDNKGRSKWLTKNGVKQHKYGASEPSYIMHISFATLAGRTVEMETLSTFHTVARVGDEHPMIYLPWQPENAKIYSARQLWLPLTVGVFFTSLCLVVGGCLVRGWKPRKSGRRGPAANR